MYCILRYSAVFFRGGLFSSRHDYVNADDVLNDYSHIIHRIVKIMMERGINPLKRYKFLFQWTKEYEEMMKMIRAWDRDVMKIVTEKKEQMNNSEMNSKDAASFLEYLLCIAKERPSLVTDEDIHNELNFIVFGVIMFI